MCRNSRQTSFCVCKGVQFLWLSRHHPLHGGLKIDKKILELKEILMLKSTFLLQVQIEKNIQKYKKYCIKQKRI